jgi:hypothetical protein
VNEGRGASIRRCDHCHGGRGMYAPLRTVSAPLLPRSFTSPVLAMEIVRSKEEVGMIVGRLGYSSLAIVKTSARKTLPC